MSLFKRIFASNPFGEDEKPSKKRNTRNSKPAGLIPNPFHPHCGPGTDPISKEKSSSAVDEACRQHDFMYAAIEANGYSPMFNSGMSDDVFIDRQLSTGTLAGRLYALPFQIKRFFAPRLPASAESFIKKATMVRKSYRYGKKIKRRRGKRRRRSSKSMKRLTRLQIYKTIGIRNVDRRVFYSLFKGTFQTAADGSAQPDTAYTNNSYMFHLCTLNDFYHYYQTYTRNAGLTTQSMNTVDNPDQADNPYITASYADCTLSNLSNVNLEIVPVRIQSKFDISNNDPGAYTTYTDHVSAYNILTQLVDSIKNVCSTGIGAKINTVQAPGAVTQAGSNLIPNPENRSFQAPNFQFPTGWPIPWNMLRKKFDIKIGKPQVLRVQSTIKVRCPGHKGMMPANQMDAQTAPSSAVSSSISINRAPSVFAKKTVSYFYIVRQASHIAASSGNAGEAYLGGPFRVACDIARHTKAVGIPPITGQTNTSGQVCDFVDLRPWANAGNATAMVDTAEIGSAVSSLVT